MDINKHKSHIDAIEKIFDIYPKLSDFLRRDDDSSYEEWSRYLSWINGQKTLLKECLRKLKEDYSYGSIFPVIREIYENFWFINLAMNGTKYYKYFHAKKGHSIKSIYDKWVKDLTDAHNKGEWQDVLEICLKGRIRVTYKGHRIKSEGKVGDEIIPFYYFLFDEYDPIEAYVGKQKKIIEKYLTPPHLFHRFVLSNKNFKNDYFEFQNGIITHLLLNGLITEKQKQRVIIHYNFLSLWSHPNKTAFNYSKDTTFLNYKQEHIHMDRLILLYLGNLSVMFLEAFLIFLKRQEDEKKIKKPDKSKLDELTNELKNIHKIIDYFWFIYNKPSKFYKYDYAINKIWRKHMVQPTITRVNLSQIKDSDIPYYNNPLESLKKMNQGWTNTLLGQYTPEIKWE